MGYITNGLQGLKHYNATSRFILIYRRVHFFLLRNTLLLQYKYKKALSLLTFTLQQHCTAKISPEFYLCFFFFALNCHGVLKIVQRYCQCLCCTMSYGYLFNMNWVILSPICGITKTGRVLTTYCSGLFLNWKCQFLHLR